MDARFDDVKDVEIVVGAFAVIPRKGTENAAAYDLFTTSDVTIYPGRQVVSTGLKMTLPPHCQGQIEPRSGMSLHGMVGADFCCTVMNTSGKFETRYYKRNSRFWGLFSSVEEVFPNIKDSMKRYDADVMVGKADEDYTGTVGVLIKSHEKKPFVIPAHTAIAQYTIQRVVTANWVPVRKLKKTDRGDGGFGHTGTSLVKP